MKLFKKTKNLLLLATVLTMAAACSSKPVVQDFPVTAVPSEEISTFENDMKTAQSNQVEVLSPDNFEDAREALEDAKESYAKGKDAEDTLKKVALGKAYLRNANSVAEVARENIQDVISARQAAITAGAPAYFGKEFKKADDELEDVTEDIENNKLSKAAKERSELQASYLNLELMAIKEKHLGESRNTIALARKERAEKFAPITLAAAEKSYLDTQAYITANRHNTVAIETRAADTKKAALHALNINRTAKGTDKVSSEETALAMEQERMRVAAKEAQLTNVRSELENTQGTLQQTQGSLQDTQGELQSTQSALQGTVIANSALMTEQQKLEAEKQLNEKYEAARKQFSSNEAEVYKQGNALLIRLKGIKFPSAKATIPNQNKDLLEKVSKVMDDFGSSNVVIEGHTDSVGGKEVNERLSQNRAEAVKNYLQSNNGGIDTEETKIEAVGYGYQKPLASNKTANGRAQNRRVDIVIKPETSRE